MKKLEDAFSSVVIGLMKGVTYAESNPALWQSLLELQARVRDHVAVLGLELVLDPAEGYAYLRQRPAAAVGGEGEAELPRLVPRRQLSFQVSLILALLRKKLAEFDATSGDTRLIMSRDDIAELVKLFLADGSNEARQQDRIDQHLQRLVELGFLQKLRGKDDLFEVRRILKAFVDAQWLSELNQRLSDYRAYGAGEQEPSP